MEAPIGTLGWWKDTPLTGRRGILDCILRLMQQEEISRCKACELVAYGIEWQQAFWEVGEGAALAAPSTELPKAPWDKLNFYDPTTDLRPVTPEEHNSGRRRACGWMPTLTSEGCNLPHRHPGPCNVEGGGPVPPQSKTEAG